MTRLIGVANIALCTFCPVDIATPGERGKNQLKIKVIRIKYYTFHHATQTLWLAIKLQVISLIFKQGHHSLSNIISYAERTPRICFKLGVTMIANQAPTIANQIQFLFFRHDWSCYWSYIQMNFANHIWKDKKTPFQV